MSYPLKVRKAGWEDTSKEDRKEEQQAGGRPGGSQDHTVQRGVGLEQAGLAGGGHGDALNRPLLPDRGLAAVRKQKTSGGH